MKQLLLATHNRHKVEEFRALLRGLEVEVLTLDSFPQVGEIVEDADTLEGNALKKAREVFRFTGLPSVADDTGLEVRYLNDTPGVLSSRYAGEHASYEDNWKKLLARLKGVPPRRRGARFRSVLAFVAPGVPGTTVEGSCLGDIIESPRGRNGFGYDPVFLPRGYQETFAEMKLDLKNTISHRAKSLEALRPVLQSYFQP